MKPSPSVRHNVIANFLGRAWSSLVSLAVIPVYIKLLGVEAYGLLGIFMSLSALMVMLDMGLSATLSRELSRLSEQANSEQEARNLVHTFQILYWTTSVLIGIAFAALAPLIAANWIQSASVSRETLQQVLMFMGASIALQWPGSLYASGLVGLQRQVALNGIRSLMVTIQHGGAILILTLVSPSIILFFCWQAAVGLATTLALATWLWRLLPAAGQRAAFDRLLLLKNWRFAAGVTGISTMAIVLTQLDKVILSKLLTLEVFGYYVLAFNVANILSTLGNPIFSALFPRFSQLVASRSEHALSALYHDGGQLISLVVLPVAVTLGFFAQEILSIWLDSTSVAENTHQLLSLLIVGTTINALMTLPYALMLSYGWTRLVFMQNLASIALLVPLMVLMVNSYGAIGATVVWIILNAGYVLILIPIMHRRLLRSEIRKWYVQQFVVPVAIVFSIGVVSRMLLPVDLSTAQLLVWIVGTYCSSVIALAFFFPLTRGRLFLSFARMKG